MYICKCTNPECGVTFWKLTDKMYNTIGVSSIPTKNVELVMQHEHKTEIIHL